MRADRKEIFRSRFQKHYSRLCSIAYGYVSDRDDSEDIVQELFISIWNKGLDSMPEAEFTAYVTTSVRNSCISFLRKRKEDVVSIEDCLFLAGDVTDDSPEAGHESPSPAELLESALATLPPKCKDIFLMAKLQGLKYREIAQKLELSEKTVENQMTKAIKMLRAYAAENRSLLAVAIILLLSIIVNR